MSGTHQHGPTHSFTAGLAIGRGVAVKLLSTGKLAIAGLLDEYIGWMETPSFADGDVRLVRLRNSQGTVVVLTAAAVTKGDLLFVRAIGEHDATSAGAIRAGIALEDGAASGLLIEMMPLA